MRFETKEEAKRLIAEERTALDLHRGQSLFHPEAGIHYVTPMVREAFSEEELWELLYRHLEGDIGEAEPCDPESPFLRSLFAVNGRLLWIVSCFKPHFTVFTFTVFS